MKKIMKGLLAVLLLTTLVGCSNDSETSDKGDTQKLIVGFVTDTGGLGDQGYNDAVHAGAKRASEEIGFELKIVESKEINDYTNNMRALFTDNADVVICAGASFADAIIEVAAEYPNKHFVVFDAEVKDLANVSSSMFREEEAAFLLGAFAGLASKTNKVGYIAGVESPLQERAKNGFEAGFKTTNPSGEVTGIYAGTYNDVGKGKETAKLLYEQGADYVATFAGACNLGVFQAATEAGNNKYALGAALGQFDKNPQKIIASQVKTVDLAVYNALADFSAGKFTATTVTRGIEQGGVDLLFNPDATVTDPIITAEIKLKIEEIRTQIVEGKIIIPLTKEDLANFRP